MEFQVRLTFQAERDLERIGKHIALDDEQAAETFCRELLFEAKSLRTFPRRVGSFAGRPNIRKLPYENYLIFYKIYEDTHVVEILRFWHAARNQNRLRLKEEPPAYKTDIDPVVERAHLDEIQKRREALASEQGAPVSGDEVLQRARALLP